jgi:hypothetical protein
MLEGRTRLMALPAERQSLLTALTHDLAATVVADANHLLRTYDTREWPADNEVLAAALALRIASGDHDPGLAAGLAALQTSLSTIDHAGAGGLPPSTVARDRLTGGDVPRGCALSWTVAMRGLYDPPRAHDLYQRYRAGYFVDLLIAVGFREWPRGTSRPSDSDSGPIVLGVGAAASGIGVGAARLAGATADHEHLRASAESMMSAAIHGGPQAEVAEAMLLWAITARAWMP